MAGFTHPSQESSPGLVIAPRHGGGRDLVGAVDIPPIRCDLPHQPQARIGLHGDGSMAPAGSIEASLFILLGSPVLAARIKNGSRPSSIPRHAAIIAKSALSRSVVAHGDVSKSG